MSVLLSLAVAYSIVVLQRYDCAMDHQVVISSKGAEWAMGSNPIADKDLAIWRPTLELTKVSLGDAIQDEVRVTWNEDIAQIRGSHHFQWLAPGQFAFSSERQSACTFTEKGCVSMVEVSDVDERTALISITPAGSAHDSKAGTRSFLHLISLGKCTRTKVAK